VALETGVRLGPYEIVAPIGRGGMGEVYRARDSRLGRDVAIKVLPPSLASDPERVRRFEREARLLAALSHPNIGAIYGLEDAHGTVGLVLELIEGPTLADRLAAGSLKVQEALRVARQLAEALEVAHERGIIHRDLKPTNIKVMANGTVKVLDFGLAKAFVGDGPNGDIAALPTVTIDGTVEGLVAGTPAYMSPEQACGQTVDKRTDIWAFGCVFYEMLTGISPFARRTVSDTLSAVVNAELDWTRLPATLSSETQQLLRRCLEKDLAKRKRDIGDVRVELDHAFRDGDRDRTQTTSSRRRWQWIGAGAAMLSLVGLGTTFLVRDRFLSSPPLEPAVQLTDFNDSTLAPALSPDGRMLTFLRGGNFGTSADPGQVWVKLLPNGEPVQLTRDEWSKEQPVFHPDGSRIVYTALMQGFRWDSWHVPVLGGTPQPFLPNASGLVWIDKRRLLYSEIMSGVHMGIVTSTETRTDHRPVYWPPVEGGMAHRSALSPDGKSLLIVEMEGGGWLPCRLMPFDASSTGRLVGPPDAQCTTAAWSPDGRWMYFSSNAGGGFHIWRQRYPNGAPEQISSGPAEQEGTAVTPDGHHFITSIGFQQGSIGMHDTAGERQITSEGFAMLPTMLPNGDRLFYLVRDSAARAYGSGELWSRNLTTGERQLLLPGSVMSSYSISHDGKKVVFTSVGASGGEDGIWVAELDRRTPPRQLTRSGEFRAFYGAPGEIIYINQGAVRHLYRMKDDGSASQMLIPDAVNNLMSVSPDGRWAFVLLLRTAAEGGGTYMQLVSTRDERRVPVCSDACVLGFGPVRLQAPPLSWSADGKSLFVSLQYFGLRTRRTIILPNRSDLPPEQLWPRGLRTEADVAANPGAKVVIEANVFPAQDSSAYLFWRRTTHSNLYRMPLPR